MTIALVPARSGSKGVPDKNFRPFAGSSLVEITLRQAKAIVGSESVFLTSNHPNAEDISSRLNVNFIPRPSQLCSDSTNAIQVVEHAIEKIEFSRASLEEDELILYLQPTSPLRDVVKIQNTLLDPMFSLGFVSVRPAIETAFKQLIVDNQGLGQSLFRDKSLISKNRQNLPSTYVPNGNIFAFRRSALPAEEFPIFGLPAIVEIEGNFDIDTLEEFEIAERQYLRLVSRSDRRI